MVPPRRAQPGGVRGSVALTPPFVLSREATALFERAEGSFPAPIAYAVRCFEGARYGEEQREAAVLGMRVSVHLLAVVALAARAQDTPAHETRRVATARISRRPGR